MGECLISRRGGGGSSSPEIENEITINNTHGNIHIIWNVVKSEQNNLIRLTGYYTMATGYAMRQNVSSITLDGTTISGTDHALTEADPAVVTRTLAAGDLSKLVQVGGVLGSTHRTQAGSYTDNFTASSLITVSYDA